MEDWKRVAGKISNWGRWGSDDQLGTLNLITADRIVTAARCVRQGKTFPLAIPLDGDGPQGANGLRRNPIHVVTVDGADSDIGQRLGGHGGTRGREIAKDRGVARFTDDFLIFGPQTSTQWDALCHVYYDGELYNGFASGSVTSVGATKTGIDQLAKSGNVVGRGILIDVARHRGVAHLSANEVIYPDELDEVASSQGVTVTEGDILVVRTGWWRTFRDGALSGEEWMAGTPGLSWRCAEWLWQRGIAAVAADNVSVEAKAPANDVPLAFHMLTLRDMGLPLGEMWDLEALGLDCAEDGVYEFLLAAPALFIAGGIGTPVNPVAMK